MKHGKEAGVRLRRSDFPLFPQKGAGRPLLQVRVEKRFGVVSTDSQESSQQQVLFFVFQDKSFAEEVVAVDFCGEDKTWWGFNSGRNLA
jgi:hypothetical protein